MWECDGKPCDFCLENDGAIVEADENGDPIESFPNGCDSPDDSHRFCECVVHQLDVPAGGAQDDLPQAIPTHTANGDHDPTGAATLAALIALYGVGVLASRHARDVAAQQQAQQQQNEDDDTDDDEGDD